MRVTSEKKEDKVHRTHRCSVWLFLQILKFQSKSQVSSKLLECHETSHSIWDIFLFETKKFLSERMPQLFIFFLFSTSVSVLCTLWSNVFRIKDAHCVGSWIFFCIFVLHLCNKYFVLQIDALLLTEVDREYGHRVDYCTPNCTPSSRLFVDQVIQTFLLHFSKTSCQSDIKHISFPNKFGLKIKITKIELSNFTERDVIFLHSVKPSAKHVKNRNNVFHNEITSNCESFPLPFELNKTLRQQFMAWNCKSILHAFVFVSPHEGPRLMSWNEALTACSHLGGFLPILNSDEDIETLVSIVQKFTDLTYRNALFIGMNEKVS